MTEKSLTKKDRKQSGKKNYRKHSVSYVNPCPDDTQCVSSGYANQCPDDTECVSSGYANQCPDYTQCVSSGYANQCPDYTQCVSSGHAIPHKIKKYFQNFKNIFCIYFTNYILQIIFYFKL